MEAELVAATRQLGLLKEGYSKARDNLRAEQSVSLGERGNEKEREETRKRERGTERVTRKKREKGHHVVDGKNFGDHAFVSIRCTISPVCRL